MHVSSTRKFLLYLLLVFASTMLCGFQETDPQIDQKLVDNIEIKTFIVSRDRLADIFRSDEDPVQQTNGELTKKMNDRVDIYLVAKIKNKNDQAVSGILWLKPYGYWEGLPYVLDHLEAHMTSFNVYVSLISSGFRASHENDIPYFTELPSPVKKNWEKLYVE
jgi:hypothetical protein